MHLNNNFHIANPEWDECMIVLAMWRASPLASPSWWVSTCWFYSGRGCQRGIPMKARQCHKTWVGGHNHIIFFCQIALYWLSHNFPPPHYKSNSLDLGLSWLMRAMIPHTSGGSAAPLGIEEENPSSLVLPPPMRVAKRTVHPSPQATGSPPSARCILHTFVLRNNFRMRGRGGGFLLRDHFWKHDETEAGVAKRVIYHPLGLSAIVCGSAQCERALTDQPQGATWTSAKLMAKQTLVMCTQPISLWVGQSKRGKKNFAQGGRMVLHEFMYISIETRQGISAKNH